MATAQLAINAPGLWSAAAELSSARSHADARESYVYVVGEKQSGKTAIIHNAVRPGAPQKTGSELVDFWVIRKPSTGDRSETACVWELPGDDAVSEALATKEKIPTPIPLCAFFLPAKSINTAAVIITVDLSRPWSVVESCCTWLQRVTHALSEHYRALEKRGSPLPKQLKLKDRAARASAARADKGSIDGEGVLFSGVQVLICANKWDKVEKLPTASKSVLARALRCVAHAHGCHLMYTASTTQPGANGLKGDDSMQKKLRALLTHMMLSGFERKLCALHSAGITYHCPRTMHLLLAIAFTASLWIQEICLYRPVSSISALSASRTHPEVSPDGPLCVLHGTDSFSRIGLPDGTRFTERDSALAMWRAEVKKTFPAPPTPEGPPALESFESNSSVYLRFCQHQQSVLWFQHLCTSAALLADIDAVVLQIREHVKTREAKDKAQSEKRKTAAKKASS